MRSRISIDRVFVFSIVLATSLSIFLATVAFAERRLVREENGITVEEEGAADRALPILTGTTTMAVTPAEVAAWISATHTFVDWQHNCEEARQIRKEGVYTIGYNRIGSPWPVSDRDVVLRSTRENLDGGGIRMEFRSIADDEIPVKRGVVRMPRLVGSYDLTPVEGGTRVIYTVDSDPGGSLPNWLVKQASKNLPYLTLKNLRERAESGPPPPE
jgi:hypothetical protein